MLGNTYHHLADPRRALVASDLRAGSRARKEDDRVRRSSPLQKKIRAFGDLLLDKLLLNAYAGRQTYTHWADASNICASREPA